MNNQGRAGRTRRCFHGYRRFRKPYLPCLRVLQIHVDVENEIAHLLNSPPTCHRVSEPGGEAALAAVAIAISADALISSCTPGRNGHNPEAARMLKARGEGLIQHVETPGLDRGPRLKRRVDEMKAEERDLGRGCVVGSTAQPRPDGNEGGEDRPHSCAHRHGSAAKTAVLLVSRIRSSLTRLRHPLMRTSESRDTSNHMILVWLWI